MTTFADLGLRAPLVDALAAAGIDAPFPIQTLTIPDALAGRDVCGKARTGSGKTLAFGLPMLERVPPGAAPRRPRGLVLVPTRELASQIVAVLQPLSGATGVRVGAFYGGTRLDNDDKALRAGVDVAVATPGRFIDLLERGTVALDALRFLVVDEADRMADMGFLPQVEWILRKTGGHAPQVLLFSATLDGQVDVLVRRYLHDPVFHEVVVDDDDAAGDLRHHFFEVHQMDRVKVVASIAKAHTRTIVFVRTKRGADRLATQLAREGVRAAAIHGDLRQAARERSLERFAGGKLEVLVATDVAARGIHVDDIDVVVHFDLPEDHKAYVHRSGRTARAGRTGAVATFVLWNELLEAERLQKRLGLRQPVEKVFSNDPRLGALAS